MLTLGHVFLLVYLWAGCRAGELYPSSNGTCTKETCVEACDGPCRFLQCVGLPANDTGKEHVQRLKAIMEATLDLYTFMRSSLTGVPFLELQGALELHPLEVVEVYQDEELVHMWLAVKIRPLLRSISKHFLACLSTKNFSCTTYQAVVQEFSQHFSDMNPARQKWIYTFFMYPFLSGEGIAGCARPEESSEDWLMKNFGAFRAMARIMDFSQLNMVFNGLEVLHLLSPEQKAELLLRPEVAGLDNGTLSLVFNSLMEGGRGHYPGPRPGPNTTSGPWAGPGNWTALGPSHPPGYGHDHNYTMSGYPDSDDYGNGYSDNHKYYYSDSSPPTLGEFVYGLTKAIKPLSHLVSDFVSLTHTQDVSEIRSTTLIQLLLNWTLAEVVSSYKPQIGYEPAPEEIFNLTVEEWYSQVVLPILQTFLQPGEDSISEEIQLAFHNIFYLDSGMANDTLSELEETCSISLQSQCGLTNAVEDVAHVLHCMRSSHLSLTEDSIMALVAEMTNRLSSLVQELATTDFEEVVDYFRELFHQVDSPVLAPENLEDPDFVRLWFRVKLLPLLPDVPLDLLACLSMKNFTCPVYQALVEELSEHMPRLDPELIHSPMVYEHFIFPFLLNHNDTDPHCVSSAEDSEEWLEDNFGFFSVFATLRELYQLNPSFAALETLEILSPQQTAQLLVLPLPSPEGKEVIINAVFDYLLQAPEEHQFQEVVHYTAMLAREVNPPCAVIRLIIERLYAALQSLNPLFEPFTYEHIDKLIQAAPKDCLPQNVTCPITQFNGSHICIGVNSTGLQTYLSMSDSMTVSCNFPLEEYACAKLENFTAGQLVSLLKCDLPGNHSHSRRVWKLLLTKHLPVLEAALDRLANMSTVMIGPSASEVLDVIGELRVGLLSDEQLRDADLMRFWFSGRLKGFLASASGRFLNCLVDRNLSCQSYQQILEAFSGQFDNMSPEQQHTVLRRLVLPFLSRQDPDRGCVSGLNSTEWLQRNLGRFSALLSLGDLLNLNPAFSPLEALPLLSPGQTAELLLLPALSPEPQREVIQAVFTFLRAAPGDRRFLEVLDHLVDLSEQLEGNVSCSTYRTIFTELDRAMVMVPLHVAAAIAHSKLRLFSHIPRDCIIYSGQCPVLVLNETSICAEVNSTLLQQYLDRGKINQSVCDFSVEEYACASLPDLAAEDLAAVLTCNNSRASRAPLAVWELLFSETTKVLGPALDLLANMTFNPSYPATSLILEAINNIRLQMLPPEIYESEAFIRLWFGQRLRPFLSAISPDTLSCLSTKNLSCSTYQALVQIFSQHLPSMELETQVNVNVFFIRPFLTRNHTEDPNCSDNTTSGQWLQKNFGGFSALISVSDLQMLNADFAPLEALPYLTVRQLSEVSSTPGLLTTPDQVNMVLGRVPSSQLDAFFDYVSPAIMGQEDRFPSPVRAAMLQQVFDRANLSDPAVSDAEVLVWLNDRLRPLLVDLSPSHVAPFFSLVAGRNCSTEQDGVGILNSNISTLNNSTLNNIHDQIILLLREPTPLRCYDNNNNQSFYGFLNGRFMGFQYPNLTTFLSLMPESRQPELVNSMPPSELGELLRRPDIVDDGANLCLLYSLYTNTPVFLETETLPEAVGRQTLPCVWPTALSSTERSEVDAWFDRRLPNYLGFLTKDLLTSAATQNASCLAFQRLVSTLATHDYADADFTTRDVYGVIRSYLTSETVPKCYNASDPELNSTAWFVEYIGAFTPFLTLNDLNTFGPVQVFTVNVQNLALFNQSSLPVNLTAFLTELLYQQDSNFNPLLLPLQFRCSALASSFGQLNAVQSSIVLHNLTTHCTDLDPQISAALAANFGDDLTTDAIAALSEESATSISAGQINTASPQVLLASLGILGSATGWNQGQALAIVQALTSSGELQITNQATLTMLGSLVVGVPSSVFGSIAGTELISASQDPTFLAHFISAPTIVQQTFVAQIISVNISSTAIIDNVPDALATEIPRSFLVFSSTTVVRRLNRKTWRKQQAVLFFDTVANGMQDQENNISSSLLAGFTCTRVVTLTKARIPRLVRACRRSGRQRVILQETQLTCMYNLIKNETDVTSFNLYPPDVLLYYDYSLVPQANCKSYFQELAEADFSVFSTTLQFKRAELFTNARSCLGITGTGLSENNVMVLGNMCCTLDSSVIENSDPSILEKLKNCKDFTSQQVTAMETLLLSGNTTYGAPSTWNGQTLEDLEILPLYLTQPFYEEFDTRTKRRFLRTFLRTLRENGVSRQKKRRMKREIRASIRSRRTRAADEECTSGAITQVTISDPSFPFDYTTAAQFNSCLSAATTRDNLAAITQAVDDTEYLRIVLDKLQEAYASTSSIPEDQVKVLGPASRTATSEDVSMWNITQIDTLSDLMNTANGEWDPTLAEAIISKYLTHPGNSLGTAELNQIGGANLCALSISVLRNISANSIRNANELTITNCSIENKRALFTIAQEAFSTTRAVMVPITEFQLITSYLGGADSSYINLLADSSVNMDLPTFTSLDPEVVPSLTVPQVRGLLGSNTDDLTAYKDDPLVQDWASRQSQTDLDGLVSGLTVAPAGGTTTTTTTTTTTITTTASGGDGTRPDIFCLLTLLLVFLTSQHILST
ncbi:unnamed protein product [Arctogadus glacialis]